MSGELAGVWNVIGIGTGSRNEVLDMPSMESAVEYAKSLLARADEDAEVYVVKTVAVVRKEIRYTVEEPGVPGKGVL